jgi:hypothetical protein
MSTVITNVELARLLTLRAAVKLEILGMKRSGRPATVITKELLGITVRSKKEVLMALELAITEAKAA